MLDVESSLVNVSPTVWIAAQCSRYLLFSYHERYPDNWDATSLDEFELMCPKA